MRLVTVGLFLSLVLTSLASPVYGIWNHLPPQVPSKRFYGIYQHLPHADAERDKRFRFLYWTPMDE